MKSAFILASLLALVAAQAPTLPKGAPKGKGPGGPPTGGDPPAGGAAPGAGGKGDRAAAFQAMQQCFQKCGADNGYTPGAAKDGGARPCQDKFPAKGTGPPEPGAPLPDLVPGITCLCADAKVSATVKCSSACGGFAAKITGNWDNTCKDPKAAMDRVSAAIAKFGQGGKGGKGGFPGGGKGGKGGKGGFSGGKGGKGGFPGGGKGGKGGAGFPGKGAGGAGFPGKGGAGGLPGLGAPAGGSSS